MTTRIPQHLQLTSILDAYMLNRCKDRGSPPLPPAKGRASPTAPNLRDRLLYHNPSLTTTLDKLSNYELRQLVAVVDTYTRALNVKRKNYQEFHRQLRAENAAIHGSGIAKRSTSSGIATNQQVAKRVNRETQLREKLALGEKLLEQAISNLKV